MAHDLSADLDQLLPQCRQRPMFHRLGQGERPEEVAEIVGQCMKLKPDGIVAGKHALNGITLAVESGIEWEQDFAVDLIVDDGLCAALR